jgi:chorismate mutase
MAMVEENGIAVEDIASVIFTATSDLDTAYPAVVAREMGWGQTPLLCLQEMRVVGSLPYCIRVLLSWNTDKAPSEVIHIYLREAQRLRPDLVGRNPVAHRNTEVTS